MRSIRPALSIILILNAVGLWGQNQTLSGYIRDAGNGETLIGASVAVLGSTQGAYTNEYGFYSLSLPSGQYQITASYVGFSSKTLEVDLTDGNQRIDFDLEEEGAELAEVVVTATEKDKNVRDVQMSVQQLDMSTIEKLPTLLGETDVIRSVILLPGVTTVGEGAAGFNVRGGSIDQNLVILDEAPVYNSSHLFGLFSVFNPDAVKGVKLYKGGIPSRYGGRLSSILDVRMREGNYKNFEAQGGVGTIFSRLAIEAPIVKDKASFLVAGRRSYIDVLAAPFLSGDLGDTELNFFDLTLKTNYRIGPRDQLFLSGYLGRDVFGFDAQSGFNWGNQTATLRWNHIFGDRLFSNLTAYYSNYDYELAFGDDDTFDWNARIINYSAKPEFSFFITPENILRFGGQTIYYEFQPANAFSNNGGDRIDFSLEKQFALESSAFVEHELSIGNRWKLNYGLRLSHFAYFGGRQVYEYGESAPGTEKPLVGVTEVPTGEVVEDWINLEPRFALQYQINETSSWKMSYMRTAQYIHLLSNTTASVPVDIWTPSTNNIDPQIADQVALGYFRNFGENVYELSIETYYKTYNNLIDYIDGADLLLNEFVESQVLSGIGRAFGLELMVEKRTGRFNGWVNYTLARTERLIEGINNDNWYSSRFDQTHNLNITGFYELSKRATLSASFTFNSGTPLTLPSSGYYQQGLYIPNVDDNARNNYRIPDYHRLDVSLTLARNPLKPKKRFEGEWVFGVYNLYGRRNAFSIYGSQQDERIPMGGVAQPEAIRFSVLGSVVPSVSYNFKFK